MSALNKNISILGCGWLGLALAKSLVKKGFNVKGSAMNEEHLEEIKEVGAQSYKVALTPNINSDVDMSFFESDTLISCIPPKRRPDIVEYYPKQIQQLAENVNNGRIKNIVFISSTSVYPNTQNTVIEEEKAEPEKDSGKALVKAESILLSNQSFKTTIIRFGGLIGYDRHPGRFLAGGKNLKNGNIPVNLIHRDDCILIIEEILKQDIWQEVFNACCPEHPTRKEFYTKAATKAGLPGPEFLSAQQQEFKLVDSSKLISQLDYQFIFNNPMDTI